MKDKKNSIIGLVIIGLIIFGDIIFFKTLFSGKNDDYKNDSNNNNTYSYEHKCEYPGCNNYASKTKYCSKHNQTKCSRAGCNNIEAYQGAGLCREHLYQSIQNY